MSVWMRCGRRAPVVLLVLAAVGAMCALAPDAHAKQRLALVIGVGAYKETNGIAKLQAPAHDAERIGEALGLLRDRFTVEVLTDADVADKGAFEAKFESFLGRIRSGDEVLFYFSGHGYHVPTKGNFFLLPTAKSQTVYLRDELTPAAARELVTEEQKAKSYAEWIARVALAEEEIEKRIGARGAAAIIIVADACRNLLTNTKGARLDTLASSIALPQQTTRGTFRLYSTSQGQISLDSASPIPRPAGAPKVTAADRDKGAKGKKEAEIKNSLFTRILLSKLVVPGLEINLLAAQVKIDVRTAARNQGAEQIPDFTQAADSTDFFFWPLDAPGELAALCQTAETEVTQLRFAVASGSIGREELERRRFELSRCSADIAKALSQLVRLEQQGLGALLTNPGQAAASFDPNDPTQVCEVTGSSPLDPNRPQGIAGVELQQVALAAVGREIDPSVAGREIQSVIAACEEAIRQRPLVARFTFNAGRAYYALATMTDKDIDQAIALAKSSIYLKRAVDIGYAAAYNDLALMHQNGEYYDVRADGSATRMPVDREKAAELLARGSSLNHALAQYNYGMAIKNSDLPIQLRSLPVAAQDREKMDAFRAAAAFDPLSKAAERGYVPAMIEVALALHAGRGVQEPNSARAIDLLETAASRGSWEAMYQLGEVYRTTRDKDLSRAIVWHARAAEAGDPRSQQVLAEMMISGEGLPAAQTESAGRYLRLAAEAGVEKAQLRLAKFVRDAQVPFRPNVGAQPDGGAGEIRALLDSAFERGVVEAGFDLAQLFRTGYPKDIGSAAIPRDPQTAIIYFRKTIEKVLQAEPGTDSSDPRWEFRSGFEIIKMHDGGEAKRRDGTLLLTEDEIRLLREEYGDASKVTYIRAVALGPVVCIGAPDDLWVMVWNWDRAEPPTTRQFDWWERRYRCHEEVRNSIRADAKRRGLKEVVIPKDEALGVTKIVRERVRKEYEAAQKAKNSKKAGPPPKTFLDRMVDLVSPPQGKSKR